MTLASLAFTYVLGGLTFIPLVLALVLLPAWYLLPKENRDGGDTDTKNGHGNGLVDLNPIEGKDADLAREGAAEGTFAVLRSYHFQSALTTLNAKTGNAANTNGTVEGAPEATGESVYQSMYRSVFDRNKNASTTSTLLEQEEVTADANTKAKRKMVNASVFYIVLRHGHLMLYDSVSQLEVRHVISLNHHSISLSDGDDDKPMMDADLFIKRTAIVLTPKVTSDSRLQPQSARAKPFYLFSTLCSDKEDFYQALLTTRPVPPVPQLIAPEAAIKLQSSLHSSSLTPETRAFNAILGRIFLSLHRTAFLENLIRTKIENKIARVQKPAFIAALTVQSIDLGDAAPILSSPRLRDLNISGDMTLGLDLRYSGGVKVVIAALAKIDLGSRFKTRTIELMLATSVQRMHGHILVRIKPPPANRIWFTFESMPEMDIKVEPVVSQRQITYTFILRAIEDRIRGVIGETLVKPNWDDVPFFDTRKQQIRGGIWKDEGRGVEDDLEPEVGEPSTGELLKDRNEKTMSMPVLPSKAASSSTTSLVPEHITIPATLRSKDQANELKRRSVASHPAAAAMKAAAIAVEADPPRPLRSPSFTSPSIPVVALNGAHGTPVRADDTALQQASRRWSSRPLQPISNRRDAVEGLREMRDRDAAREAGDGPYNHSPRGSITEIGERGSSQTPNFDSITPPDAVSLASRDDEDAGMLSSDVGFMSTSSSPSNTMRIRRAGTAASAATTMSSSSSTGSTPQVQQQRGKAILAATAAATNAARNWSWNVISKRGSAETGRGGAHLAQSRTVGLSKSPILAGQPIGRGQPLPPPGQPLPGPKQRVRSGGGTLWGTGMGPIGRKPVNSKSLGGDEVKDQAPRLPPRPRPSRSGSEESDSEKPRQSSPNRSVRDVSPNTHIEGSIETEPFELLADHDENGKLELGRDGDEFGPWRQNSGTNVEVDASLRGPLIVTGEAGEEEVGKGLLLVDDGKSTSFADTIRVAAESAAKNSRVPPSLSSKRRQAPLTPRSTNEAVGPPEGDHAILTSGLSAMHTEGSVGATDELIRSTDQDGAYSVSALTLSGSSNQTQQQELLSQTGESSAPSPELSEDDLLALDMVNANGSHTVSQIDTAGLVETVQSRADSHEQALERSSFPNFMSDQPPESASSETQRKFAHGQEIGEDDFSSAVPETKLGGEEATSETLVQRKDGSNTGTDQDNPPPSMERNGKERKRSL